MEIKKVTETEKELLNTLALTKDEVKRDAIR